MFFEVTMIDGKHKLLNSDSIEYVDLFEYDANEYPGAIITLKSGESLKVKNDYVDIKYRLATR